ncbi:hypothetical protein TNCT1_69330 [Streptomyces sp. 1-11]|nr:hypothetical protein TNCT1_69330 [Streptomyces sp. 1-11]
MAPRGRPEGPGARILHVALDDLAAHGDFLRAQSEGDGLDGQGLVHVGCEVQGADHEVHAGRVQGPQKRMLMKAPTSWKPTLRYVRRAAVLKSFT